jgi:hypothetical protein
MIEHIRHYNRSFIVNEPPDDFIAADGRPPTPIELWNHGCANRGAPQKVTRDRVRANLLHVGGARETSEGLRFEGLLYAPMHGNANDVFVRVPGRKCNRHEVKHDPRDVSTILLPLDRGTKFQPFTLTPKCERYRGWTLDEVKDHRAMVGTATRTCDDNRPRSAARTQAAVAEHEQRARAAVAGIPVAKTRKLGDREARADEVRELRREGAWTQDDFIPSERGPAQTAPEEVPPRAEDVPSAPTQPNHISMIRARRAAARMQQNGA